MDTEIKSFIFPRRKVRIVLPGTTSEQKLSGETEVGRNPEGTRLI